MLRKKRLTIGVDFRRGVRHTEAAEIETMDVTGRMVTEPSAESGERERYVRGRILALVNF